VKVHKDDDDDDYGDGTNNDDDVDDCTQSYWLQQSLFILIFDVVDHLRSQLRGMIMYLISATSATNPMKIECCR